MVNLAGALSKLVVGAALLGLASLGCQQAPPEQSEPARSGFEDDNWEGSEAAAESGDSTAGTEAGARDVQQGWDEVRQSDDPAEQERKASELLEQTRALADGTPPPAP
jgi:hypothetical protein